MKPLHVRVAEVLGWTHISPGNTMNLDDPGVGYPPSLPIVGQKEAIPRYDTDWAATGPLIERMRLYLYWADDARLWIAQPPFSDQVDKPHVFAGDTPLIAVCNLIVELGPNP